MLRCTNSIPSSLVLFLKNLAFTILVPGTVAGLVPYLLSRPGPAAELPWRLLGVLLWALGGAVYGWCVWDFATVGRGTPAPIDAPKRLVARGLYRWVRNPMYLGVLGVILGWAAFFRNAGLVVYGIGIGTMFHLFVRFYEEPRLQQLFGEEYRDYRARVRRWWPRPPAAHREQGKDSACPP